jgi:hypothetical protein
VVAHAVKTAQGLGVDLSELSLETLQKFDSRIEADVFGPLSLQGSMNARNTLGGTAPIGELLNASLSRATVCIVVLNLLTNHIHLGDRLVVASGVALVHLAVQGHCRSAQASHIHSASRWVVEVFFKEILGPATERGDG